MLATRVRCRASLGAVSHVAQHSVSVCPQHRSTVRAHSDTTLRNVADIGSDAAWSRYTTGVINVLDLLLPRSRFGSSIFNTPLLLLFRLFYQARSFELPSDRAEAFSYEIHARPSASLSEARSDVFEWRHHHHHAQSLHRAVNLSSKITPSEWLASMSDDQASPYSSTTLRSLTWVKSLSAPLSHEFIQMILECETSGRRYRIIAERDTYGDSVHCLASTRHGSMTSGLTRADVALLNESDEQHKLPLPLLSLSWSPLATIRQT